MKFQRYILLVFVFLFSASLIEGQSLKIINDRINNLKKEESKPLQFQAKRYNEATQSDDKLDTSQETAIQPLPSILSPYASDEFKVIPSIEILASKLVRDEKNASVYTGKIFTSTAGIDTSFAQNGINFLLPEASKLGFSFQFIKGWQFVNNDKNIFGLNLDFNFLGKELPNLDNEGNITNKENVLVFHPVIGVEALLLENVLSIYAHGNGVGVISNVNAYKQYFDIEKSKFHLYFDFGIRAAFDVNKKMNNSTQNTLFLDLGFIANGGEIGSFVNRNDPLTPKIKVGFNVLFNINKWKTKNNGGGSGGGNGSGGDGNQDTLSEENILAPPADKDIDQDGIPNASETDGDTDGDKTKNIDDPDDDGDGIPTLKEGSTQDTDKDGIPDYLDDDDDNDGIPTLNEGSTQDTDKDGIPDYLDDDDDNDKKLTKDELGKGGLPQDLNGNGKWDHLEKDF